MQSVNSSANIIRLESMNIVTIVEDPNDEAVMSVLLTTGELGIVRGDTLKAFQMSEADEERRIRVMLDINVGFLMSEQSA